MLGDIYHSFISHLFEYTDIPLSDKSLPAPLSSEGQAFSSSAPFLHSGLCLKAREDLFGRMRTALGATETPLPSAAIDSLHSLYEWLRDNVLFRTDRQEQREAVLQLFSADRYDWLVGDQPKPAEIWKVKWSDEDLIRLFSHLVNFAYVEVDTLYRQIYIPTIYHPLMDERVTDAAIDQVWIPLYQSSAGVAAQVGGYSIGNTFLTANGLVANEDLILGSVCTMYVGIGLQEIDPKSDELPLPEARWNLHFENGGVRWEDLLTANIGQKSCVAVLLCSFPLAGVFPDSDYHTEKAWEPASDLFKLLMHVCRNYEQSILQDLELQRRNRATELYLRALGEGMKPMEDAVIRQEPNFDTVQRNVLKALASKNTRGNPIGGLVSVRRSESVTDLRISVPFLEHALTPHIAGYLEKPLREYLDRYPTVQEKIGSVSLDGTPPAQGSGPLMEFLAEHIVPITLAAPHPDGLEASDSQATILLILHCTRELSEEEYQTLQERISASLSETLRFLGRIRWHYFEALREWYLQKQQNPPTFQQGKIIRDTCENVALTIGQVTAIGFQQEGEHLRHIDRLIHLAQRCLPGSRSPRKVSENRYGAEFKVLDAATRDLRKILLGVSVFYYSPQNLDPEPTLHQIGDIKDIRDWREEWGSGGRNRIRRTFVSAFMRQELNAQPLTVFVSDKTGQIRWFDEKKKGPRLIEITFKKRIPPTPDSLAKLQFEVCDLNPFNGVRSDAQEIHWMVSPRYRVAGITLNQDTLEGALKARMNNGMEIDELLTSLTNHLNAGSEPTLFGTKHPEKATAEEEAIAIYTLKGHWRQQGAEQVDSLRSYEKRQAEQLQAAIAKERADIGAGMFHNLKYYLQALQLDGSAVEHYMKTPGTERTVAEIALRKAWMLKRLIRFHQAVEEYVKPHDKQTYVTLDSLHDIPQEAFLVQTFATARTYQAMQEGSARTLSEKYESMISLLDAETRQFVFQAARGRREIYERISKRGPEDFIQKLNPGMSDICDWWRRRFGLVINVEGDFSALRGRRDILIGVLEELLLNAFVGVSQTMAPVSDPTIDLESYWKYRLPPYTLVDLPAPHIRLIAEGEGTNGKIKVCNWAWKQITEAQFERPKGENGWGLYAMRLLMKRISGGLICTTSKTQEVNGKELYLVEFTITL